MVTSKPTVPTQIFPADDFPENKVRDAFAVGGGTPVVQRLPFVRHIPDDGVAVDAEPVKAQSVIM